jgi:hypothetical protein
MKITSHKSMIRVTCITSLKCNLTNIIMLKYKEVKVSKTSKNEADEPEKIVKKEKSLFMCVSKTLFLTI